MWSSHGDTVVGGGRLQPGSCSAVFMKLLWGRGERGSWECPLITGSGDLQLCAGLKSELGAVAGAGLAGSSQASVTGSFADPDLGPLSDLAAL